MASSDKNGSYEASYLLPSISEAIKPYANRIKGIHPECNAVPEISGRDFDTLVDSIKAQGVMTPIQIDEDGLLVDGRCRLRACYVLGNTLSESLIVQSEFDAIAISNSNFARRHLTDDQKAMRGTRVLEEEKKKAIKRKKMGAEKGRSTRAKSLGTDAVPSQVEKRREPKRREPRAIENAAKKSSVSREKLALAAKLKSANPELAASVESGDLSLQDACNSAGIASTKKKKRKRQQLPAKSTTSSGDESSLDRIVYEDSHLKVVDQNDSVRIAEFHDSITCCDLNSGTNAFVYRCKNKWLIRKPGNSKNRSAKDKSAAIKSALYWLKES